MTHLPQPTTQERRPTAWRLFLGTALCLLLLAGLGGRAHAQFAEASPELAQEFIERFRQMGGDRLRLCLYQDGMTAELDRAIAQAVGEVLLVDIELVEITTAITIQGLDIIPLPEERLVIHLANDCEAFLGVNVAPGAYPEWLTVTRPYVDTGFVAVARAGELDSLAALPAGGIVGTNMLSEADIVLTAYNDSRPEAQRWRRFPYPHAGLALERLMDGTVDAAVVWEPALWFLLGADDPRVQVVPSPAPPLPSRAIGMLLRSDELYVRTAIDAAIGELLAAGLLPELYRSVDFPGQPPR